MYGSGLFLFVFQMLISVIGLCLGFGVYGCTAVLGIVAMESTVDRLAGTAHSIASLTANGL